MNIPGVRSASLMRLLKISGLVLLCLLCATFLLMAIRWPFTRAATIESLERISASNVQIAAFRKIFLPQPGYIANNVTFTRGTASARPLGSIRNITCRATWLSLITFTHKIDRTDLEGLEIYIPAPLPPPIRKHPEAKIKTSVTELVANGTVLEVAPRHGGTKSVRFEFSKLVLGNLARNQTITIRADVRNPNPPGEMKVSGSVGPLVLGKVADTPIAGVFQLIHANLATYNVIKGDLAASGRFDGTLGRALIGGRAEIPNFEVTSSRHALELTTEYHALVDGTNGNVVIQSAEAHFLATTLTAKGSINGKGGKTVSLDFDSHQARIQDLLRLFVTADRPPLEGPIAFHAHVVLPPRRHPFIKRVQLDGDFTIADANFTNPQTQHKADELSARALGKKSEMKQSSGPVEVSEAFRGNVTLRDAIARISRAAFAVPGAVARGAGTYDLTSEAIDLKGDLAMHASLSKAAGGFKSILLLPLDPFFKKKGAGAVVPVRISGTYPHPQFKVSLTRSR